LFSPGGAPAGLLSEGGDAFKNEREGDASPICRSLGAGVNVASCPTLAAAKPTGPTSCILPGGRAHEGNPSEEKEKTQKGEEKDQLYSLASPLFPPPPLQRPAARLERSTGRRLAGCVCFVVTLRWATKSADRVQPLLSLGATTIMLKWCLLASPPSSVPFLLVHLYISVKNPTKEGGSQRVVEATVSGQVVRHGHGDFRRGADQTPVGLWPVQRRR
jgi:hypothetical protein